MEFDSFTKHVPTTKGGSHDYVSVQSRLEKYLLCVEMNNIMEVHLNANRK